MSKSGHRAHGLPAPAADTCGRIYASRVEQDNAFKSHGSGFWDLSVADLLMGIELPSSK